MINPTFDRTTISVILSDAEGSSEAVISVAESFGTHVKHDASVNLGIMLLHVEEEFSEALMDALDESPSVRFAEYLPMTKSPIVVDEFTFATIDPGWSIVDRGPAQTTAAHLQSSSYLIITGACTKDQNGTLISASGFKATRNGPSFPSDVRVTFDYAFSAACAGVTSITVNAVNVPVVGFGDGWHRASVDVPIPAGASSIRVDLVIDVNPVDASTAYFSAMIDTLEMTAVNPLAPVPWVPIEGDGSIQLKWVSPYDARTCNIYWTDDGTEPTRASNKITNVESPLTLNVVNDLTYKYKMESVGLYGSSIDLGTTTIARPKHRGVEPYVPFAPLYATLQQYNAEYMDLPRAWTITKGAANIGGVVIDVGLDTQHPAYDGKLVGTINFTSNSPIGYNPGFHGDMVAGALAKETTDGVIGLCPNARIWAATSGTTGGIALSTVVLGLDYAIAQKAFGVKAANISVGGGYLYPLTVTRVSDTAFSTTNFDTSYFPNGQRIAVVDGTGLAFGTVGTAVYTQGVGTAVTVTWDTEPPSNYTGVYPLTMTIEQAVTRAYDNGIASFISMGNEGRNDPYIPSLTTSRGVMVASSVGGSLYSYSSRGSAATISAPGDGAFSTAPRYGHGVSLLNSTKTFTVNVQTGGTTGTFLTTTDIANWVGSEIVPGSGIFGAGGESDRAVVLPGSVGNSVVFSKPVRAGVSGSKTFVVAATNSYMGASGTSFASPLVMAAYLMVLSIRPNYTIDQAMQVLKDTVRQLPGAMPGKGGGGAGSIAVYRALLSLVKVHADCQVTVDYDGISTVTMDHDADDSAVLPVKIHYTTDGSVPTLASPQYTSPLNLPLGTTVTYMAADSDTVPTVGIVRTAVVPTVIPIRPVDPLPHITQFSAVQQSSGSKTVDITLVATGLAGVSQYVIGEYPDINSTPGAWFDEDFSGAWIINWQSLPPPPYTFADYSTGKTLYAWVKDANGVIDGPTSAAVSSAGGVASLSADDVTITPSISPADIIGVLPAADVTITPAVSVADLTGQLAAADVTITPVIAPAALTPTVLTGAGSIRSPGGAFLDLRSLNGQPLTVLRYTNGVWQ